MVIYDERLIARLDKSIKNAVFGIIAACFVTVAVLSCLIAVVVSTNEAGFLMKFSAGAVAVFGGWAVISIIVFSLLPNKKRKRIASFVISGQKTEVSGKVLSFGKLVTAAEGIFVKELTVAFSCGEATYFVDHFVSDDVFFEGEEVALQLCGRFVYGYEVKK